MDQLPAYEAPSLPIYSPATAGPSRLSSRTDSTTSSLESSDYTYKSDHLLVNLGPRRWGTRLPSYGFHGILDGTVKLRKSCSHVISVTATVCVSYIDEIISVKIWRSSREPSVLLRRNLVVQQPLSLAPQTQRSSPRALFCSKQNPPSSLKHSRERNTLCRSHSRDM